MLAWWGIRALQAIDLPFRVDLNVDYRVLAFAIALSLVTGVVFGLAPAIKATRVDLLQTLRDEGLQPIDHRRLTLKNALIVVQVAVSVLLLGGTSIFMQAVSAERFASAMPWTASRCSKPTHGLPATRRARRRRCTTICCGGFTRSPVSKRPR